MFQFVSKFTIKAKGLIAGCAPAQVSSQTDEDVALARHFVCP